MKEPGKWRRTIGSLFRDVLGVASIASISYGAWMVYPPAGAIVAGLLVLAGVFLHEWGARKDQGGASE